MAGHPLMPPSLPKLYMMPPTTARDLRDAVCAGHTACATQGG